MFEIEKRRVRERRGRVSERRERVREGGERVRERREKVIEGSRAIAGSGLELSRCILLHVIRGN